MRVWITVLVALGGLVGPVAGDPLPAFEVTTLQGQPAPSTSLGSPGRWLLLYVAPGSAASSKLMSLLKAERGDPTDRVVVIVGGSIAEAQAACDATPGLARAGWYADPGRSAFTALAVNGAPSAAGLQDRSVQWKMSGVPVESPTVRSILLSWIVDEQRRSGRRAQGSGPSRSIPKRSIIR